MRTKAWDFGNSLKLLAVGFFLFLAVISMHQGLTNALKPLQSQDFEYSPARLLLEKQNPYLAWINGDRKQFLLAQSPNYLPTLLYLIRPIAHLDWPIAKLTWATINLLLSLLFAYFLFRAQASPGRWFLGLTLALLFLSSTPLRNGIGNGQQSMVVLVFTFAALKTIQRPTISGVFMSVAMAKYSLGAFFLSGMLGMGKAKIALVCLVLIGISYLVVSIETGTPFGLELLLSPLRVNESGMAIYQTTIPGLVRLSVGYSGVVVLALVGIILTFLSARLSIGKHSRREVDPLKVATTATFCSLVFAPHAGYDFVFLALPLALGLRFESLSALTTVLYVANLAFFWNLTRLIDWFDSLLSSNIISALLTTSLATLSILFLSGRAWRASPETPSTANCSQT